MIESTPSRMLALRLPIRRIPPPRKSPMLIPAQSDRPATSRKAVAFCCDANYLPYALFSASQIAMLHPGRDFDICLCHTGPLVVPASLARHGFRTIRIDCAGVFDGFGLDARRTASTYLRLAMPDALAGDYDRLLYLDSDIFVQGGDIGALLEAPLGPHPAGAVRDNIQWRTPQRMAPEFKSFGQTNAPYLNAGVMLIDVSAWRAAGILDGALAFGAAHAGQMLRNDQTLLNVVLHRNWAELSPVWNWQYSAQARLHEPMLDVHIIHFIGPRKPWADAEGELPPRFAGALRTFLADHLPDHPGIRAGRDPGRNSGLMRKMLFRHLLNLSKTQRFLARFPTDTTTHPQRAS
jgi:hypothetical protein